MSLERCPGCRGRLQQGPSCLRCGCDLTLVLRAEVQARRFMTRAVHAWARADLQQASACAHAALMLEKSPLATAVLQSLRQENPKIALSEAVSPAPDFYPPV